MNLENLKYIHVHKFNIEHNNLANIIINLKVNNEPWKSEICVYKFNTVHNNVSKIVPVVN
jgi:hypothetical protein